jgi:hypothetical protein
VDLYRRRVGRVQARDRQVAENEVRFRALNERLRAGEAAWEGRDGVISLVCECGDEDCTLPITLTPAEYESVRADETQFAIVLGHVRPEVEDVVSEHGGWVVVRKRGEAGDIAAASDPRGE